MVSRSNPKPPTPPAEPRVTTAKLFRNGRSQAVRLPKEFRFEGTEVAIRRDPETGEIVLSPASKKAKVKKHRRAHSPGAISPPPGKKLSLKELFAIFDQAQFPEGFFRRETHMPRELDLF